MDKVSSALPSLGGDFGLPAVPAMATAAVAMEEQAGNAMYAFSGTLDSFKTLIGEWLTRPASILETTATSIVDLLLDQADRMIALLRDLINLAADALGALRSNPGQILAWLDAKLSIPFFGSFYETLTDRHLSFFDIACLASAICAPRTPATTGGTNRSAMDATSDDVTKARAREAAGYFMYVGNVMNALDAGVSAARPGTLYSKATTTLNMACLGGLLVCLLLDLDAIKTQIAVLAATFIAASLYGIYNKVFVIAGQALLVVAKVGLTIYNVAVQNGRQVAYNLIGTLQILLALVVNVYTTDWTWNVEGRIHRPVISRRSLDPERAFIHGAFQYMLGALNYNIYMGRPLISVQP